jgi:hypothetical protein
MNRSKLNSKGFTLIASLLLLCMLSGITIGLLMMVNTEGRAGGDDLQNTMAYRSAEGAIEKMTSDLANSFNGGAVPTASQITGLSSLMPTGDASISYPDYSLSPALTGGGALNFNYAEIQGGAFQGLYASTMPITLKATALRSLGQEVTMLRTVEIALVPVFQFGVFSDSDLGFYASPTLDFQGRVHTNADLYLGVADGSTLTFHDKITAYGNVIRNVLPNNVAYNASGVPDSGTVSILTASGGCDGAATACQAMPVTGNRWGSVTGAGGNPPQSAYNSGSPSWQSISQGTYNGWITDGNYGNAINTGASKLSLPFFTTATSTSPDTHLQPQQYEIVRRPPAGESSSSSVGAARLYNEAQIRVLLSDDPAELPGGAGDANNVRLANVKTNSAAPSYIKGVPMPSYGTLASGGYRSRYFAEASTAIPDPGNWTATSTSLAADWLFAPSLTNLDLVTASVPSSAVQAPLLSIGAALPTAAPVPLPVCTPVGTTTTPVCAPYPYYATVAPANTSTWNLLDGYLRVEVLEGTAWVGVTNEWLALGFARGLVPPVTAGSNFVDPNAILILQELADRNGDGNNPPDFTGTAPVCTKSATTGKWSCSTPVGKPPEIVKDAITNSPYYGDSLQATSLTRTNWYPINFYDTREGEARDVKPGDNSCTPNGLMNAVEIDVGNLKKWLAGTIAGTGTTVNYTNQNGYILYFSDRRGMLPNPNGTFVTGFTSAKTGDSGLEDTVNRNSASGTPDNTLEPTPAGRNQSPEDVNYNLALDTFGEANLGNGFGVATAGGNQYTRISQCLATGRANWVSGARHVVKLVDGTLGNLPTQPGGQGGFTVASENPVYVLGDYNSSSADPTWLNPAATEPPHAAAAVIADAVTMLSNSWTDLESFQSPTEPANRVASDTYYRLAVAAGKSINFNFPTWANTNPDYGLGTDGGLHNFLRFLESWNPSSGQHTLNYKGSIVSLYYSTYATGVFKCCTYAVYTPPLRNYSFDPLFSQPQNLPPGTPQFRDIDNLSYQQSFTPRSD